MNTTNLPLNVIRAFASVYQSGGIRSVAREHNTTQLSVSRHVRYLEEWTGVPLLDRESAGRALRFTVYGKTLGVATIESLNLLSTSIASIKEGRRNLILVSTTPSFASRWLLLRIAAFNAEFPWIEISVLAQQRMADPPESGADVGIRTVCGNWSDSEYEILADEEWFSVASPDFCHEHRLDVTGDDQDRLEKLTLLHDQNPQASWEKWRETFDLGWLDAGRGPRFASSDLVLNAATHGLGVALARGRLAETDTEAGRLIRLCGSAQVAVPFAYSICRTDSRAKRVGASSFVYWIRKQVVHTEWVSSGRIKAPDTAVFCTVHQSTEQWLKLVCFEARTANEKVQKGGLEARAGGLFRVRSLQDSAQPNPAAGKIRFAVLKHRKRF